MSDRPLAAKAEPWRPDRDMLFRRGGTALQAVLEQLEQGQYRRFHDFWSGLHGVAQDEARKMGWDGGNHPNAGHWGGSAYNYMLGAVTIRLMIAVDCRYEEYFSDVLDARWEAGQLADIVRRAIAISEAEMP